MKRDIEIETVATTDHVTFTITDEHGHPQTYEMNARAATRMSMQLARAATHAMGLLIDAGGKVAP